MVDNEYGRVPETDGWFTVNVSAAAWVHNEQLADAWHEWGRQPDGWFAVLHGEVVARA